MKHATVLEEKSYLLALRIVKLSHYLKKSHNEYVLSKQILRSGTSVGALIRESRYAQSRADFLNKQMIALKEASETEYWLYLLRESEYLSEKMFHSISSDTTEILKMLVASTKKTKGSKT